MVVVEGKMELASITYAFKKYSILGKDDHLKVQLHRKRVKI